MKYMICFLIIVLSSEICYEAQAMPEEDPHAEYMYDIKRPADANVNNIYNAWGENMARLIENGHKEGIVINEENNDPRISVSGVSNIVIDSHANTGAVIDNTEIKNSNIVIIKDRQNRMK